MTARATVSIYSGTKDEVVGTAPLPAVFQSPIRSDLVHFVHTNMAKNSRQAYAVTRRTGHRHSAESWGTGRAVARIPRVSGGGTSISGSGAFGNMCRGGRMFAPTKIFRRWHRKINLHQKRYAMCSALAASSLPSLLLARGHKIENIPEVPLVVEDTVQDLRKTKEAMAFLRTINAIHDVERVDASKRIRAGKGKMRNRRYVHRRGPLLVLPRRDGDRAFRNILGLDVVTINMLNLLDLAPGGHLGRFIIWTRSAFEQLDTIFGTFNDESLIKHGFTLPRPLLTTCDVTRVMQSEEVRRVLRPKVLPRKKVTKRTFPTNGYKNRKLRRRLNPYDRHRCAVLRNMAHPGMARERQVAKKKRLIKAKKHITAHRKATRKEESTAPQEAAPQ